MPYTLLKETAAERWLPHAVLLFEGLMFATYTFEYETPFVAQYITVSWYVVQSIARISLQTRLNTISCLLRST